MGRGNVLYEKVGYTGSSGNRDCQSVPRGVEGFHRRCTDYLGQQCIPKLDSTNAETVLTTAGITSLVVELVGVADMALCGLDR